MKKTERIPLNTLAICFGLAGSAGTWTAAGEVLDFPAVVPWVLWAVTAIAWIWLIAAHVVRGVAVGKGVGGQLRHPVQGPIAALVPVVGLLLGARLTLVAPIAGKAVILLALIFTGLFAAWIVRNWILGGIPADAVHGGYFLPTVAGGYIAANATSVAGWSEVALGSFAVATLFWVVILTLLMARLVIRPSLPDPLIPTLAIIAAPPAVGGLAWMQIAGSSQSVSPFAAPVQDFFTVALVLMLLVQVLLLPRYRKLAFSLGFWSFTFPLAAAGSYAVRWSDSMGAPVRVTVSVIVLVIVTTVVAAIAGRSLVELGRSRRTNDGRDVEAPLLLADDQATR